MIVYDGPPPQPVYSKPKLVLLPEGAAVLALRRMGGSAPDSGTGNQPAKRGRGPGRPKNTEKDSATLVVAALNLWHGYEDGHVTNYEPAKNRELAAKFNKGRKASEYRLSENALSRFLFDRFPQVKKPYKKYQAACLNETIGSLLMVWNRELIDRHADLRPHESGRKDDD